MESKKEFTEHIQKLGKGHFHYLNTLFENCPDYVIKHMRYMEIPKGYMLIQAGMPCEYVYIILKGKVSGLDLQMLGNVYMFMEYSETEVLGDYEVFGDIKDYRVTIRATAPCELLAISASVYLKWMKEDINALFMRTRNLMSNLTYQTSEERKYRFLGCKERLILYLIEVFERVPKRSFCKIKKTQPELAERIGFTVRTIQRNIQSLEKDGLITTELGKICLTKEQYLRLKEHAKQNLLN